MKPLETEAPVSYPAILTTEGTYTLISFPDCPGCRTFVEPGEDVLAIARDALSGWLEAAVEDREDPPHPTPQSQLSQTERVLAVPVPLDLARQLEAKWGMRVGSVAPAQHSPRKHIRPRGGPPKDSETPLTASGEETSWTRPITLLWRAVRLRCPNCGGGPLFKNWLQMQVRCPICRMRLERGEEGYQVGAYMFNIVAAELFFGAIFVGILIYRWPAPPWGLLLYGGMAMMVVTPVLFYPFSKDLFLAFDLIFRPPAPEDFA